VYADVQADVIGEPLVKFFAINPSTMLAFAHVYQKCVATLIAGPRNAH
jgi:hypothetical protein